VEYRSGEWGAKEFYDRTLDPYELESRHADPATAADREALKAALNTLVLSWGPWARAAED
jgi:hypothetical protein